MLLLVFKSFIWFCSPYISSKCHLQHCQQAWRPVTNSILMMFTLQCLDDVFNPTDSWQNGISAWCNANCEMNHAIIGTINHEHYHLGLKYSSGNIALHTIRTSRAPQLIYGAFHRVLHFLFLLKFIVRACIHVWRTRAQCVKPNRLCVTQGGYYCGGDGNYSW